MITLPTDEQRLISDAWALRKKYRKAQAQRIPMHIMCPHPANRGSVYPSPDRVVELAAEILSDKFIIEEANHLAVCIEEAPPGTQMQRFPADWNGAKTEEGKYMSLEEYNRSKTKGIPVFDKLWSQHAGMHYVTLSHTHLLLVLLSVRNGAAWPMESIPEKFRKQVERFKDGPDGPWKWSAVADCDEDIKDVFHAGMTWEVLDHRLYLEAPEGASMISVALNKQNTVGLQVSETTALNVVCGAALSSAESSTSAQVCYDTVKRKVRQQVGHFADDPAFPEFLDFALALGIRSGGWLDTFVRFAERYVDSKTRQLRIQAFGDVNKIGINYPRTKIAVLMRAYKKEPKRGWCPEPESLWGKAEAGDLQNLEAMLEYLWQACRPILDKWDSGARMKLSLKSGSTLLKDTLTGSRNKRKAKLSPVAQRCTSAGYDFMSS